MTRFQAGDRVYVTSVRGIPCDEDVVDMLGRIHTVESANPMPVQGVSDACWVDLNDVPWALHENNLKKVEQVRDESPSRRIVPAENFCGTLQVNTDNDKLSDREFRDFVRRSLPIVIFDRPGEKGDAYK